MFAKRIGMYLSLGLVCVLVASCAVNTHDDTDPAKNREFVQQYLPAAAHELVDQGKGWCTFRLNVEGKEHIILYHLMHSVATNDHDTEAFADITLETAAAKTDSGPAGMTTQAPPTPPTGIKTTASGIKTDAKPDAPTTTKP